MTDFEEEVAVVVRRNGNGSVLAYDDRERAEDAFDNHREVLRSLYDLVDRRHGSDGEKVARLEVVDDGIGEILVRDGFVRDIETDRALALADDMRHYAEGPESRELVTDGGEDVPEAEQAHPAARNADQLAWAVWSDDGRSRACYAVVADSEGEAREKAKERHGGPLDNPHIDGPFQNAEPGVFEFEYITEHRETIVLEAPTEDYARESADANRNYSGQYMETLHSESRRLDTEVNDRVE